MKVSGIVVTRGDVDLTEVVESMACLDEVIVWDNSQKRLDLKVFGRYAAIGYARNDVIFFQDDDCIVPVEEIVAAYEPGVLVANMPESRWADYPDSTLVGWGAVLDGDLPARAFELASEHVRELGVSTSEFFRLTCDVIFSALTSRKVIDVGFRHLPWAETDDRMFRQAWHKEGRDHTLALACHARREAGLLITDSRYSSTGELVMNG